jgi:hypothetical protein
VVGLFALGLATASITPTWGSTADIAKLFLAAMPSTSDAAMRRDVSASVSN